MPDNNWYIAWCPMFGFTLRQWNENQLIKVTVEIDLFFLLLSCLRCIEWTKLTSLKWAGRTMSDLWCGSLTGWAGRWRGCPTAQPDNKQRVTVAWEGERYGVIVLCKSFKVISFVKRSKQCIQPILNLQYRWCVLLSSIAIYYVLSLMKISLL